MLRPDFSAARAYALKHPLRPAPHRFEPVVEGDVFVFDDNRRHDDFDAIVDFRNGIDKIDVSRTAKFGGADFEELLAAADQIGRNVVIDMGEGTLTLEDIDLTDLEDTDFIF
jgi:hypothetical protein